MPRTRVILVELGLQPFRKELQQANYINVANSLGSPYENSKHMEVCTLACVTPSTLKKILYFS